MFSVSVVPHSPTGVERSLRSPTAHLLSYPSLPVPIPSPLVLPYPSSIPQDLTTAPTPVPTLLQSPCGRWGEDTGSEGSCELAGICFRWGALEPPHLSVPCSNHALLQLLGQATLTPANRRHQGFFFGSHLSPSQTKGGLFSDSNSPGKPLLMSPTSDATTDTETATGHQGTLCLLLASDIWLFGLSLRESHTGNSADLQGPIRGRRVAVCRVVPGSASQCLQLLLLGTFHNIHRDRRWHHRCPLSWETRGQRPRLTLAAECPGSIPKSSCSFQPQPPVWVGELCSHRRGSRKGTHQCHQSSILQLSLSLPPPPSLTQKRWNYKGTRVGDLSEERKGA